MEDKCFIWDEINEGIVLSKFSKDEDIKNFHKNKRLKIPKSKIYFPHANLNFNFKETLNFSEQTKFSKKYQRKTSQRQAASDVVMLQDIKDLAIYMVDQTINTEILGFVHLPIVDRFLRALIIYMQHYLKTWNELKLKREATTRRVSNPLAGGVRVVRSQEMRLMRCVLGREYADLILACQKEGKRYHHVEAGQISFAKSRGEKDLRIFEGLLQFAHRVTWIALERKQKDLIELEIHRLFRTKTYNTAASKYEKSFSDWQVPEDEYWILYGEEIPMKKKILRVSPLSYELLNTDCDYRILSLGLTNARVQDPRILYFENALLVQEEDLPRLGIKVGILGLLRTNFDLMLFQQASEDDQILVEDNTKDDEGSEEYLSLIPAYGSDFELTKLFLMDKFIPRYAGDKKIRNECKKKWILREVNRVASNRIDKNSVSIMLKE